MASQVDSHQLLLTTKRGKERDQKKSNDNKLEKRGEKERWADRGFVAWETDGIASASEGERRTCWTDASFSPSQQSPPERKECKGARERGSVLWYFWGGPPWDPTMAPSPGLVHLRRRSKMFPATFSKT
ncbi:hypothetical protein B296_00030596 [Ensete ventricosum]|uniref:Uncharacterized protein n=1 Tax=Ensete ventricosum TaxID=4639 RepID=A0A427AE39_ENSVE|nr:hypothetical protein B296_00030596 [Ensete ventricosum]